MPPLPAMPVLPVEFASLLEEVDTDDLAIYVSQVTGDAEKITVRIKAIADAFYRPETQNWDMHYYDVLESRISFDVAYGLELSGTHPMLWEHREAHAELYIRGTCTTPEVLIAALYQSHYETFGGLRVLEQSLNTQIALTTLLARGHGLLGKGPVSLMRQMAEIVEEQAGINTSLVVSGHTTPEPKPVFLLQLDESYLIARGLTFLRC